MRQKRNSPTRARSININTKAQRLIRAHLLMDEVIELADSGAEDLELLKIKIAARQWAAERLLAQCESEDQPRRKSRKRGPPSNSQAAQRKSSLAWLTTTASS